MAEKELYPLQYHVHVQPDLYVLLAGCYHQLNEGKKKPDETRKKELDALRYGIQKLPESGILYNELGQRKLQMEQPVEALAVFEQGIANAPNFPDNYFWAAKLLKATGNELWAWIYAEVFFNLSENEEMKRTAALLISESSQKVFSGNWLADPEQMDQELSFLFKNDCNSTLEGWDKATAIRTCLLEKWSNTNFPISVILKRMELLKKKGFLDAYLASIYLTSDKEVFLPWLAGNGQSFEAYRKWRFWNPLTLSEPVKRIIQ